MGSKITGRASSMAAGLAVGTLCSIVIVLIGTAITAKLVSEEILPENGIGYGVMVFLIVASYTGSKVSYGRIKRQKLVVCLATAGILFAVLLAVTALFFDGQYSAVGVTVLLILCGSGLAALPGKESGRGGKRRKVKIPSR